MIINQQITNNKVKIKKDINILQKYAVMGFLFGYDNYYGDVIGVTEIPVYHKRENYYTLVVQLRETETHTSTSGIGFYVSKDKSSMMIYSSHEVMTVAMTKEISELLDKAQTLGS